MCYQYGSRTLQSLHLYIQIKTAMSEDKLRILIKILVESHMAFDLGDKIDIRCTPTNRPALFSTSF